MTNAQPSFSHSVPRQSSGTAHQNTSRFDLRHETADLDSSARNVETRRIPPLMEDIAIPVYPMLAKILGINEAVVIQQIYFHINVKANSNNSNHFYEGRWWVYNSYQQWCDNHFPWLTPRGLQSIMMNLEEKGILLSVQSIGNRWDRRKWYSLNLKVLQAFLQNASMHHTKNAPSKIHFLHDDSTENTTETLNTNTSRSEALQLEKLTESPNGDVWVSDELISKSMPEWEMQAEQPDPANTTLVKGTDPSQQSRLQNRGESLSGPRRTPPPPATPALNVPFSAVPGAPKVANNMTQAAAPNPSRAATPKVANNTQAAVPNPSRASVTHGSHSVSPAHVSTSSAKPPSASTQQPSTSAPTGSQAVSFPASQMTPMYMVVAHTLKTYQGHAGKVAQFFKGTVPRGKKDLWAHHQPDIPATPQEVLALLLWYRQNPAYSASCASHGGKLPSTPAVLRDRLDEFRSSPDYDRMFAAAQPLLERLLRGEDITKRVTETPIGRVESAAAYKSYNPRNDPVYRDREIKSMSQDDIQKLLGLQK